MTITAEKYSEFKTEEIKFKNRLKSAQAGCKIPFYISYDRKRDTGLPSKKPYATTFNFRLKSGRNELSEKQSEYAKAIVNSIIFRLHFKIVSVAFLNTFGDFEIKVTPDWTYFHTQ